MRKASRRMNKMLAFHRKYDHSARWRWAFWRWTDIPPEGDLYLRRLHIVKTPIGALMLHWIKRPDKHRDLHDHPISFLSIILRGSYLEERGRIGDDEHHYRHRHWFNFVSAHRDKHRIIAVHGDVLTLVLAGPKVREWGFWTQNGWIHWKNYTGEV